MSYVFYNKIDIKELEDAFIKLYYQNMVDSGFSANLGFFDEKCTCSLNNQEFNGAYNILIKMAQENIHRFEYKDCHSNIQQTHNGYIINVVGVCRPINFQNFYLNEYHFSEVFYLSNQYPNNNKIINYISHYY